MGRTIEEIEKELDEIEKQRKELDKRETKLWDEKYKVMCEGLDERVEAFFKVGKAYLSISKLDYHSDPIVLYEILSQSKDTKWPSFMVKTITLHSYDLEFRTIVEVEKTSYEDMDNLLSGKEYIGLYELNEEDLKDIKDFLLNLNGDIEKRIEEIQDKYKE